MKRTTAIFCLLFLFGARLLSALNGTEGDSTKGKYPITDPRNPNCPCHKYQAEADKEYARLLRKPGEEEVTRVANANTFGDTRKVRKVRSAKRSFGHGRGNKPKAPKKKCFRDRLSRCFHF
jgi:hypothetical protein